MTLHGRVENGVVVIQNAALPDGTLVEVTPLPYEAGNPLAVIAAMEAEPHLSTERPERGHSFLFSFALSFSISLSTRSSHCLSGFVIPSGYGGTSSPVQPKMNFVKWSVVSVSINVRPACKNTLALSSPKV
jgi:hypothetical protein